MLVIDFLRHGALEGGIKYRGCLDESLTASGRQNMDKVWQCVQQNTTKIIASPLSRCAVPALAWSKEKGMPCVLDERVQELSYGDWEGLTAAEIRRNHPDQLEAWRADPTHLTPPNGEPMQQFAARVSSFWQELVLQQDGHVLLVAHSGSIRLLLAYALNAPIQTTRHLAMPYACWSRVEINNGQAQLVFHAKN